MSYVVFSLFPVGPSYVPIKVKPPYEDITSDNVPPPDPQLNVGGKKYSEPSNVPSGRSAPNPSNTVPYPSLPDIGTYNPPTPLGPAEQQVFSSGEQTYSKATYPNHYQQRKEVYPQPTERSNLLPPS